jgi:hypothetical protein
MEASGASYLGALVPFVLEKIASGSRWRCPQSRDGSWIGVYDAAQSQRIGKSLFPLDGLGRIAMIVLRLPVSNMS